MTLTQSSAFKEIVESRDQARAIQFVQDLIQKKAYEIDSVKAIIELADFGLFPKETAKDILSFSSQVFYKYPGRAEPTLLCLMCLYILERDEEIFALCKNILTPNQKLDVLLAMRQFIQFNYSEDFMAQVSRDGPAKFKISLDPLALTPSLVLNFSCDGHYFRKKFLKFHAGTVMESKGANTLIFLSLIDPTESDIALCERLTEVGNLRYQIIDSNRWLQEVCGRSQTDMEFLAQQKAIYACMRFMVCHELLSSLSCPVVNLDSDLVIKCSLDEYVDHSMITSESYDIALAISDRSLPGADHWAHEVLIGAGHSSYQMASLISSYILYFFKYKKGFWTLDQCAINACLRFAMANHGMEKDRIMNFLSLSSHNGFVHHYGGGFEHL